MPMNASINRIIGILFTVPKDTHRRSWLSGFFIGAFAGGAIVSHPKPVDQPYLSVDNHFNSKIAGVHLKRWDRADDVPIEDTPCGCGDPRCFLVAWKTTGEPVVT